MQNFFFCYHKVGTVLVSQILRSLQPILGWRTHSVLGLATDRDVHGDAVQFCHSLVGFDLGRYPHRGIRLVRDPRDIWLSGYLYHRRCAEGWCVNDDFGLTSPLMFPRVPYSQQSRSEGWKRDYLAGLKGRSYQENLRAMSVEDGLEFEKRRYADWTISAMMRWSHDPDTLDVKLESFAEDFDATLTEVLRHCLVPEHHMAAALSAASVADVGRMSDLDIERNDHIVSRTPSKWRTMLTREQVRAFEADYAEAIVRLGYPLSVPDGRRT